MDSFPSEEAEVKRSARPDPLPVKPQVVLASASPRRRDLLKQLVPEFRVFPVQEDEEWSRRYPPRTMVRLLGFTKAMTGASNLVALDRAVTYQFVIGADTMVLLDDQVLGKPQDAEDAREMLRRLSGREHQVVTGVACVLLENHEDTWWRQAVVETRVRFARLTEEEIARYVATGEPLDKAGAYGIQGQAAAFVEKIDGDYSNVVGLPLRKLYLMAQELRVNLWDYGG